MPGCLSTKIRTRYFFAAALLFAFASALAGCGVSSDNKDDNLQKCVVNADCPTYKYCKSNVCVDSPRPDGDELELPADVEEPSDDIETNADDEPEDGDELPIEDSDQEEKEPDTEREYSQTFQVSVISPADGEFITAGDVHIKVKVVSEPLPNEVVISINGKVAFKETSPSSAYDKVWNTENIPEGEYVISVMAKRGDDEVATASITVYLDLTQPEVEILEPKSNATFYYGDEMSIAVKAKDHLKSLVVQIDLTVELELGESELAGIELIQHVIPMTLTYVSPGNHTLIVKATDKAGHETTIRMLTFIIDPTPPLINLYYYNGADFVELPAGLKELLGNQQVKIKATDKSGFSAGSQIKMNFKGETTPFFSQQIVNTTDYELLIDWDEFIKNRDYPYTVDIIMTVSDRFGNPSSYNGSFTIKREVFNFQPRKEFGCSPYAVTSSPAISPDGAYVAAAIRNTFFGVKADDGDTLFECMTSGSPSNCQLGSGGAPITAPVSVITPISGASYALAIDQAGFVMVHDLRVNLDRCQYFNAAQTAGLTGLKFDHGIALGRVFQHETNGVGVPLYVCGTSATSPVQTACIRINFFPEKLTDTYAAMSVAWTKSIADVSGATSPLFWDYTLSQYVFVTLGNQIARLDVDSGEIQKSYPIGAAVLSPVPDPVNDTISVGGSNFYSMLPLDLSSAYSTLSITDKTLSGYSGLVDRSRNHIFIAQAKDQYGLWQGSLMQFAVKSDNTFNETAAFVYTLLKEHRIDSTPVIGKNGIVYLADRIANGSSIFYAIKRETNTTLWKITFEKEIKAPLTMGTNGFIYFTTQDGYLRAIASSSFGYDNVAAWPMFGGNPQHTFNVIKQ